jgi:tetratricopeptide (TPR) repeat protein
MGALRAPALSGALVLLLGCEGRRATFPPPRPVARSVQPTVADFLGAEACASCHSTEYAAWRRSTHGRAGGRAGPGVVIAPFTGAPIRFADAVVTPVASGGEYRFTVVREGSAPVVFRIDGVIGGGHMLGGGTQGFVSRFPDGTMRFLPFEFVRREGVWFCNTNSRSRRGWIPITRDVRLAECGDWPPVRVLGDVTRYANCQSCHGSQIVAHFDTAQRRYDTRLTALTINCESCHGPGRRHVELARAGAIGRSADIGMRSLATLDKDASLEVCYQCHALKDVLQAGYLPGRSLRDYYSLGLSLLGEHPLFPDGRVRTFAYQETQRYSDCYRNGSLKCVDCHDPHSQGYRDVNGVPVTDRFSDGQCTSCHPSKADHPEAHTHHPVNSTGSRCVACHMPYLQEPEVGGGHAIRYARSDHTIPIPRPVADQAEGVTSACRQCHETESAEQLDAQVRAWYGQLKPQGMSELAGLVALFEDSLTADMSSLPAEVVQRLERLAQSGDVDGRALALASLHLGRGEDAAVRRFLAGELEHLDSLDDPIRKRWGVALGFVADRYRQRGDPTQAALVYRKALEIRPNEPRVLLNLGLALADAGDVTSAIESYRQSLAVDPAQPLAHVNWGIALEAVGDTAGALAEFRQAAAVDPNEPLAYFNVGVVALARGNGREALEPLGRAAALDPGLAPAHFALAQVHLLAGDAPAATRELRLGLEFDPGNAAARELLEQIKRVSGAR